MKITGTPLKLSETPGRVKHLAPLPGEHNEEILQGRLGYTPEQIAALYREGAIVQEEKVRELREMGRL
ncbi:MAG: hypothetical protein K6U89_19275 [Chloroflexi bacterium]|nr:hypothetical protein [Chloroflexota bacterium]